MFLTFWPMWGREVKREYYFSGLQEGNQEMLHSGGFKGYFWKTGCGCGLLGASLVAKEVGNSVRLQSSPMDHCGWRFSGLGRSPRFDTSMKNMKAKLKLAA